MTSNNLQNQITLRGLKLNVFLGWPEAERHQAQVVFADIHIQFPATLKACHSDNLADTYCYATLVNNLENNLGQRQFKLLEHFGHEIYQFIKQNVAQEVKVSVRVQKQPPIPNLTGGVTFYCGEENNSW